MGSSKNELFTKDQNDLAEIAKAIAHPARIAILQHLLKVDQCVCGGIVDIIGLSQATISQHLKAMKEAGLIKGIVSGRKVCYCINESKYLEFGSILSNLFAKDFTANQDCC